MVCTQLFWLMMLAMAMRCLCPPDKHSPRARALITDPPLILADEPTGALDSKTSQEILLLLKELHQTGKTILVVTHSAEVTALCDRAIVIRDGSIAQ